MLWIEGITRENTKLVALAGDRNTYPLCTLSELPKLPGRRQKSKFDTNFQEWELAPTTDYLHGMDLPISSARTHHVFRFNHEDTCYLVPAQVLFKAVFRPLKLMSAYLFRPQGIEQVCVPTLSAGAVDFVMWGLNKRTQNCSSLQQPLSWMWCFPSARRMWASVYDYACRGILGCDLPFGNARIAATGVRKKQLFFVTEMTVLRITTAEEPFEFASNHPRTIIFHEGIAFRNRRRSDFVARADSTILPLNGRWGLIDQEWQAIYPLFEEQEKRGSMKRKHELRSLIDGILTKLGSGIPWKKFQFKTGTWSNACKLYGECRKDGRWAQIQAILRCSRGAPT